jgi:hypothetical protein
MDYFTISTQIWFRDVPNTYSLFVSAETDHIEETDEGFSLTAAHEQFLEALQTVNPELIAKFWFEEEVFQEYFEEPPVNDVFFVDPIELVLEAYGFTEVKVFYLTPLDGITL